MFDRIFNGPVQTFAKTDAMPYFQVISVNVATER